MWVSKKHMDTVNSWHSLSSGKNLIITGYLLGLTVFGKLEEGNPEPRKHSWREKCAFPVTDTSQSWLLMSIIHVFRKALVRSCGYTARGLWKWDMWSTGTYLQRSGCWDSNWWQDNGEYEGKEERGRKSLELQGSLPEASAPVFGMVAR